MQKNELGFDESMSRAIEAHTTGLPNMDNLAKILFIADITSAERNFEDIELILKLAEKNLDDAILYILNKKIEIQIKKNNLIHTNSIITRNSILEEKRKEEY